MTRHGIAPPPQTIGRGGTPVLGMAYPRYILVYPTGLHYSYCMDVTHLVSQRTFITSRTDETRHSPCPLLYSTLAPAGCVWRVNSVQGRVAGAGRSVIHKPGPLIYEKHPPPLVDRKLRVTSQLPATASAAAYVCLECMCN